MSFRDNMQHLRATRNMTQEQLAMLLGVTRQSVSKWEAERAYPEMDKLLKICSLFGCTLDELVTGDVTDRPADEASRMPSAQIPQDVTGYDQAMCAFAWKLPLGVSFVIAGAALAMLFAPATLFPGSLYQSYSSVLMLVGAVVGLSVILPAVFARRGFRKAHPFVEDFYTPEQRNQARRSLLLGLVVGVGLVVAGLGATIVMQPDPWLSSAVFLLLVAGGVFLIVRGCLLNSRCKVEAYNRKSLGELDDGQIEALDDEGLQVQAREARREKATYALVMSLATAVAVVFLFVPALGGQRWFFLPWLIGAGICGALRAYRSLKG